METFMAIYDTNVAYSRNLLPTFSGIKKNMLFCLFLFNVHHFHEVTEEWVGPSEDSSAGS